MIVILEGPRGTGKTTLCAELVRRLNDDGLPAEVHKGQRVGDPIEGMLSTLSEKFSTDRIWVVDRFHLTEWVMSIHLQRRDFVELTRDIRHIDTLLDQAWALGFILEAPDVVLLDRIQQRNDGRGMEMPLSESRKLWDAASKLTQFMSVVQNGDEIDRQNLLAIMCSHITSRWITSRIQQSAIAILEGPKHGA